MKQQKKKNYPSRKSLALKKHLCKQCKKNPRVTLYFCQECREKHNKRTRELKRKYRKEGKCVMCGEKSFGKRLCNLCKNKNYEYIKNSDFIQSKKIKSGKEGQLKKIIEVL